MTKKRAPQKRQEDSPPPSRTALVVLGMHRSGTSALAGVLGHMGADLPQELMPPNESNPHGYFESMKAYWLNDALLTSAGSSWDDWKPINPDWYQSPRRREYHDRATEMLGLEFGRSAFFVLKDPRVCRLLPFWKDVLHDNGIRPLFVCTHRHPQEVVASLARREGWSASQGLLLWLRHVLDAEAGSRGAPRVFVSYDMLLADWRQALARISKGLPLHWPVTPDSMAPMITGFLSDALRHFRASGAEAQQDPLLDGWVGEVYAILECWAVSGESKTDHARLDAIRAAMQEAEPMFDPLLRENQQQRQHAETQRRRIEELEVALHAKHLEAVSHQTNHATEQRMRGDAEIRITELTQTLDQTSAEAASHQANHASEQRHREAVEMQRAELARAFETAQAVATEQTAALAAAETQVANQIRALASAEAEHATLAQAQARLEDDLRVSQAATMTAVQEAAQLRSALIQRGQETEDLHRQTLTDAARITVLETTLSDLTRDHAALTRQAARDGRHLAAMTARLTTVMQRDLERRLTGQIEQAAATRAAQEVEQLRQELAQREQDAATLQRQAATEAARIAGLEATLSEITRDHAALTKQTAQVTAARAALAKEAEQLHRSLAQHGAESEVLKRQTAADTARITVLETTLSDLTRDHAALIGQTAQAAAASIAQEAEVLQQRRLADEHIAALQAHVQAVHDSTSWKLTSPLRRISATLRHPKT